MNNTKTLKQPFYERSWFWTILVFLIFSIHVLTSKFGEQHHDAAFYWYFAKSFVKSGQFSIFNYDNPLRGYLYPLLNFPIAWMVQKNATSPGQEIIAIKLIGALIAGAVFGFAGPKLWMLATGTSRLSWVRRLLFILTGLLFWRDYFNFALTDFPALLALLLALIVAFSVRGNLGFFLSGVLVAASLYIRPIFLLSVPFVFALCLLKQLNYRGDKLLNIRSLMAVLFFGLGLFLVGLPQYLINNKHFNSNSFLVLADSKTYYVNGKPNLYLWQLNVGLQTQRYETHIGEDYPNQSVIFNDLAGRTMMSLDGVTSFDSYGEYFAFVLKRPVDTIALYARHLFNGLDIWYTSPYVAKIHGHTFWISFLNYTFIFVALLIIVASNIKLRPEHWLLLGAILLPCAACIPIAVECRFFLPLHFLLCAIACFGWPAHWQWRNSARPQLTRLAATYSLYLLICFMLSSSTQATLALATKIIQP